MKVTFCSSLPVILFLISTSNGDSDPETAVKRISEISKLLVEKVPKQSCSHIFFIAECMEYKDLVSRTDKNPSLDPESELRPEKMYDCPLTGMIVFEKDSKADEFPHMAAIGVKTNDSIEFFCDGSLISEKFVLTVAHCSLSR